tara:strand:- start:342 stop:1835 length:1494 start_codon:yes stop_codon:yes gene_type:complete
MNYIIASVLIGTISCTDAVAGSTVAGVNAQFARDLYASRSSILIIGDSTTQPVGAGSFVTYYEGLVQTRPESIQFCGFRVSGSTGNTGVNGYISMTGGSTDQLENGRILNLSQEINVGTTQHSPPGYRAELTMLENGVLSSVGRFIASGLVNLEGILANADQWVEDSTMVLRTPFFISNDGSTITRFSMSQIIDYDGSAGNNVGLFDRVGQVDVQLDNDRFGLQYFDSVIVNPKNARFGVQFSGDLDSNDADESGKTLAWSHHSLFNQELADDDRGLYLDSISIGGFTAKDHAETLDPLILDDYFAAAPRPYNTVLIWLGQNSETDEWNGELQPIWGERIEAITDIALQAAIDSGATSLPMPILITPPLATEEEYPAVRFIAESTVLTEIATRRGWGHIDLHSLLGTSLYAIDPALLDGGGPHPSQEGAIFFTQLIYDHLACIRADYNGDDARNFLDVSEFLALFAVQNPQADMNGDRSYNFLDISDFLQAFTTPCP